METDRFTSELPVSRAKDWGWSTGARWGELVGQQRHEYDAERRGIEIRAPLEEVGGKVHKGGLRLTTITPMAVSGRRPGAGTPGPRRAGRNSCRVSVRGAATGSGVGEQRPPILSTFTFHEGRHTHSTWLTEDGIPEVARRARLGPPMSTTTWPDNDVGIVCSSRAWTPFRLSKYPRRGPRNGGSAVVAGWWSG